MTPLPLEVSKLEVEPIEIVGNVKKQKQHFSLETLTTVQIEEAAALMIESSSPINGGKCCCCPCCCCDESCCCCC